MVTNSLGEAAVCIDPRVVLSALRTKLLGPGYPSYNTSEACRQNEKLDIDTKSNYLSISSHTHEYFYTTPIIYSIVVASSP
jgi:hypothetical protein